MSDTTTDRSEVLPVIQRTPETEMVEKGANVGSAASLALEDINPLNAHLFRENRFQDHFAR
ncbi:MAG: cytochrome P450, partial [Acidimicrobiales bacterium]